MRSPDATLCTFLSTWMTLTGLRLLLSRHTLVEILERHSKSSSRPAVSQPLTIYSLYCNICEPYLQDASITPARTPMARKSWRRHKASGCEKKFIDRLVSLKLVKVSAVPFRG